MKISNICFSYQPPGESHQEVMERFIRLGVASEELNFDGFYTLEHHFTEFGITGNLYVACANILGRTKRIQVGTMGIVLPTEHPARHVESLLVLDQLSKGRFNYGTVRGLYHKDFRVFGTSQEDSRKTAENFYAMILDASKTGVLHTDGEVVEFPDVNVYPEAYSKKQPTCMTAESSETITYLAERGLPMVLSWIVPVSEKVSQMELYNEVAAEHGHDINNIEHILTFICSVNEDGEKADSVCRNFLENWYDSYKNATNIFNDSNQTRGYDYLKAQWREWVMKGLADPRRRLDYSNELNPVGTPERCIEIIQSNIDATGIKHITVGFEANGSEQEIRESMELFMEKVAPHLKDPQ
ncbi:alkanal monooxygenase [Photobacterium leiognathi]